MGRSVPFRSKNQGQDHFSCILFAFCKDTAVPLLYLIGAFEKARKIFRSVKPIRVGASFSLRYKKIIKTSMKSYPIADFINYKSFFVPPVFITLNMES